ncbi:MAG: heparinase II/III domain-containing protein [Promethearchaeota archaeon]
MTHKRRKLFFIILMTLLMIGNIILLILSLHLFPTYGGFTRQIIFIKPNDNQTKGYFIIIDELAPETQKYDIDWVLHSRGDLKTSSNDQVFTYTVPSYISNNDISLRGYFLETVDRIEKEEGYFLPTHYDEDYAYDDFKDSYIKASYSGAKNPLMATVLYPKNDSDQNQEFPDIEISNSGLRQIGETDYLYYSMGDSEFKNSNPDINFDGKSFFLRENATDGNKLEYFFAYNAYNLEFKDIAYFSSSSKMDYLLVTYSNLTQISGCFKPSSEFHGKINLYCPFDAVMLKIDGKNNTFTQDGDEITFIINGPSSFAISKTNKYSNPEYDPLREDMPIRIKAKQKVWDFDKSLIEDLNHPYTLYNQIELKSIRNKIADPKKNWSDWYSSYVLGVDEINDADDYPNEDKYYYLYKLALKYVIDGGENYLNLIKEFLSKMGKINHYSQDLRRAYAVQAYATVLDMVYNNLTKSDQEKFSDYLYLQAYPLMWMDLYPENNHRVVDAGGLGMAGLVLKNKTMINTAINTILTYYYSMNPADGGSYESYSYNAFAMDEFMQFSVSLNRIGGYNLFTDPMILASFDFMAETLGPLGMPSLYEDCTFSSRLQEVILIAAANLNNTHPNKAQNFQYIWEQRQNNSLFEAKSDAYYSYLNGGSPSFRRIMCYNVNNTIKAKPYTSRKEIWKESSMAFLRSADKPNALFLSFSCKNYPQSHVHYDENSFEIWAYGAYIVHNPGYPGFGVKYHDWTINTEGSNTLLISGSGQRQEEADGLSASISSPYFSMIIGKATTIYNDLGSFEYFPEIYYLIVSVFVLIGIVSFLFLRLSKKEEIKTSKEVKDEHSMQQSRKSSKINLLAGALLHPLLTIDHIQNNDPERKDATFLTKFLKFLIAGLMALFFLIIALEIKTVADYHLQYYEDKAAGVFDILKIVVILLLIIGPFITFLFSFAAINIYNQINKSLVYNILEEREMDFTKKDIKNISTYSLIWQFPVLIFSFILLYLTTTQNIQWAINTASVGSGSIVSIYAKLLLLFRGFFTNIFLIILFEIPFLLITLWIFSNGIFKISREKISRKKARKIALIGMLFLLIILFILLISTVLILKYILSLISIETSIEG